MEICDSILLFIYILYCHWWTNYY